MYAMGMAVCMAIFLWRFSMAMWMQFGCNLQFPGDQKVQQIIKKKNPKMFHRVFNNGKLKTLISNEDKLLYISTTWMKHSVNIYVIKICSKSDTNDAMWCLSRSKCE